MRNKGKSKRQESKLNKKEKKERERRQVIIKSNKTKHTEKRIQGEMIKKYTYKKSNTLPTGHQGPRPPDLRQQQSRSSLTFGPFNNVIQNLYFL